MDFLFLLLVIVCVLGLYLALDNRQLRKDYAELIIERDGLRKRLTKAEKNDYKVKGKYAKRPA